MAWRPHALLRKGEIDNTQRGRITGTLHFFGMDEPVSLTLQGDCHRDLRGARLRLRERSEAPVHWDRATQMMQGFATRQTGVAGDMTAGLPPYDYGESPYLEWYSEANGRVVLELSPSDVEVIGDPLPWQQEQPINPNRSRVLLEEFVGSLATEHGAVGIVLKRK